jgi:hypothetical protein
MAAAGAIKKPDGEQKPDNFLAFSILAAIFWPMLGVPAIIFASSVNSLWDAGERVRAKRYSKNAKTFCLLSLYVVLGVIGWIGTYVAYVMFVVGTTLM